jgi:uncharacterized membrane protein
MNCHFVYVVCRIECLRCVVEHLLWFHQDIHAYIMSLMFQKFEIFMRKKNWLQKIEICMKVLCIESLETRKLKQGL